MLQQRFLWLPDHDIQNLPARPGHRPEKRFNEPAMG
jgi:hypothetical protein